MKKGFHFILLAVVTLQGCQSNFPSATEETQKHEGDITQSFSDPHEVIDYVNDEENGFVKQKNVSEFSYSAVLTPRAYLLAKHRLNNSGTVSKMSDYENLMHFEIRIQVEDFAGEAIKYQLSDLAEYENRLNYCAFGMQSDLSLIAGKDTLPCALFHFERTFGIVPFLHFSIAFEPPIILDAPVTLVFNDRLFHTGILKFYFPKGESSNLVLS